MKLVKLALVAALVFAFQVQSAGAAPLLDDDVLPGKPMAKMNYGDVDSTNDPNDVFRVYAQAGETLTLSMLGPGTGENFDLALYSPSATDFNIAHRIAIAITPGTSTENLVYPVMQDGWYYLQVEAVSGSGWYTVSLDKSWSTPPSPPTPVRLSGSDRYKTAVDIAEEAFPGWANVEHVILASGEDRAAADPLAASGLVWAYGGPILLTSSTYVPSSVIGALQGIAAANGSVIVHVVGGPASVPEARLNDIAAQVSGVTFDRITPYGDRYTLAGSIADRMIQERPYEAWSDSLALIANGEDPDKFFDALALSPIAARNGLPILLVKRDSIPSATANALGSLGINDIRVAGGPNTISDTVIGQLGQGSVFIDRWYGQDRYETARVVMNKAKSPFFVPPWVDASSIGVASKLPDALTGGAFVGLRGGCILLTKPDSVPSATSGFLQNNKPVVGECFVFGGTNSVSDSTMAAIGAQLVP